jgi:hypothetical protein
MPEANVKEVKHEEVKTNKAEETDSLDEMLRSLQK